MRKKRKGKKERTKIHLSGLHKYSVNLWTEKKIFSGEGGKEKKKKSGERMTCEKVGERGGGARRGSWSLEEWGGMKWEAI